MTEQELKQIGFNIRIQRVKQNLTITELAKRSNLSINLLSFIENGKQKGVRTTTILKIANALNVDYKELFGKEEQ